MTRLLSGTLTFCALLSAGCFAHQYRVNPRVATVDGDAIVQMKPPGEMPSALEATLVPADRHSDRPDEFDQVIGLVVDSQPRAYPIGLLDRVEVVDDSAADRPLVVTPKGAGLCRPSEQVFDLLERRPGTFTKEDGEVVRPG